MATITRAEVINRAEEAFNIAGYYYGGNYWDNPIRVKYVGAESEHINPYTGNKYPVVPDSSSPYIACDCAAFVGWAWAVAPSSVWSGDFTSGGTFGRNYRARQRTGDVSVDFAGITEGDVLWRSGHVALFCGDYVLELSTSDWSSTTNGHGGNRSGLQRMLSFDGFCSFDGTFSTEFDREIEVPEQVIPSGSTDQASHPPDMSANSAILYPYNIQYTKRYVLRKSARRY